MVAKMDRPCMAFVFFRTDRYCQEQHMDRVPAQSNRHKDLIGRSKGFAPAGGKAALENSDILFKFPLRM